MESLTTANVDELFMLMLGREAARRHSSLPKFYELRTTSVGELTAGCGLTDAAAAEVLAVLELVRRIGAERMDRAASMTGSASVHRHAVAIRLPDIHVEQLRLLLLDRKYCLVEDMLISQGTLTSSPVHPQEVHHPAIRAKGATVVHLRNHSSGDRTPSADDVEIAWRLVEVGESAGIRIVNHVIVGGQSYVSLSDRGLLR